MISSKADWDSLWKRGFAYGKLDGWAREIFVAIADLLTGIDQPLILSAGCGRGLIDYWLVKVFGYHVTFLDSSGRCIRNLKKSLKGLDSRDYGVCHASILDIPYPNQSFDLVWNEGVLEHLSDEEYLRALNEMKRVSRRYILVDVPHARCRPYVLVKQWLEENGRWAWGYENPKASLKEDYARLGLKVIVEKSIGGRVTIRNYLDMVPPDHRKDILNQLTEQDYHTFPHLLAIGEIAGE